MSANAARVVIAAAVLIVLAVFWMTRESPTEQAHEAEPDNSQVVDTVVPEMPPAPGVRREWFPDLSEVPVGTTASGSGSEGSGRFDCSLDDYWSEIEDEEHDARFALLADTLSQSPNAEDQLAAAIIRGVGAPEQRTDSLVEALTADPMHELVLWQAADDCRRGRGGEYCTDSNVRATIESVLGGNGWYWTQVAAFYHGQGMFDESLSALRRAVSAPEFNDYFVDNVLLMERALSADSDRAYVDRVISSIGFAAAMPADFLARECAARAEADDSWRDACTMLAERYEHEGSNLMMQTIGLGMQENLYESSGLMAEARDAEIRKAEMLKLLEQAGGDYQLVQWLDPQLSARYLDVWAASGEVAALEFAVESVDALLEDPDYDPCVYLPIN